MHQTRKTHLILGVVVVAFAVFLMGVWIPLDTTTGVVETVRRQTVIGDSLAPMVAGVFLLIGGALVLLFERGSPDQPQVDMINLKFVGLVAATLAFGFLIMRYAGPLTVWATNMLSGGALEYRLLRDTAPWKYIGFFLGGVFAITGVISLTEGRLSARALGIGVAAILVMIALYDLPFDDLLLPPNGDV